jgi:hypothetical protein
MEVHPREGAVEMGNQPGRGIRRQSVPKEDFGSYRLPSLLPRIFKSSFLLGGGHVRQGQGHIFTGGVVELPPA